MANVKPVPDEYPQVIPYLIVDGAANAIEFYKDVFGATERARMSRPDGNIAHAELDIGRSVVMLADLTPDMGAATPAALGGTPITMMVYVEAVDDVFKRAIDAGATPKGTVQDQFYGDRTGEFTDPFGYKWMVASHVEDVSPEEMQKRAEAATSGPTTT